MFVYRWCPYATETLLGNAFEISRKRVEKRRLSPRTSSVGTNRQPLLYIRDEEEEPKENEEPKGNEEPKENEEQRSV